LDQFDKTESPIIPDTYLIYLALKCITSIINEFSNEIFNNNVDINSQQAIIQEISKKPVENNIIKNMSDIAWSGFLAALSFLLTANIEDTLFSLVLTSYQHFTVLCGYFNLTVPQDAFIISLCKTSLPESNLSNSSGGSGKMNTLSFDRSISCIQTFLNISFILSSRFTEANWYLIIDTLQEADNNISIMNSNKTQASTLSSPSVASSISKSFDIRGKRSSNFTSKSNPSSNNASQTSLANAVVFNEEQIKEIKKSIDGFFQDSINMTPFTFKKFYTALVTISGELYGVKSKESLTNVLRVSGNKDLKKSMTTTHSFVLEKLQFVTLLNIDRLIYKQEEDENDKNNDKEIEIDDQIKDEASEGDLLDDGIEMKSSENKEGESTAVMSNHMSSWNILINYLISMAHSKIISNQLREQVCTAMFEILIYIVKHCFIEDNKKEDPKYKKEIEERVINTLYQLIMNSNDLTNDKNITMMNTEGEELSEKDKNNVTNSILDAKKAGLERLNDIIQIGGHYFSFIWEKVFIIINSVLDIQKEDQLSGILGSKGKLTSVHNSKEDITSSKHSIKESISSIPPSSNLNVKYLALIREGFSCLQLICTDFLLLLSPMNIYYCINTISHYAEFSGDTNISLTAIGLSWNVMDHLQTKRIGLTYHEDENQFLAQNYDSTKTYEVITKEESQLYPNKTNPIYQSWLKDNGGEWNIESLNSLYLYLVDHLSHLCFDTHSEIRNSANQTLYNTINMNGYYLNLDLWHECLWVVLFPLLKKIQEESEKASEQSFSLEEKLATSKKWDEIKVLTLNGMTQCFHNFKNILIYLEDSFEKAWSEYLNYLIRWNKSSLEISYYIEEEEDSPSPINTTITDKGNIKSIIEGYSKVIESNITAISNSISTINILNQQQLDQSDNEKEAVERIKNIKENIKNNISIINNAVAKIETHFINYIENGNEPMAEDHSLFKYIQYINEKLIEINESSKNIKLSEEDLASIKTIDLEKLQALNKEKNENRLSTSNSNVDLRKDEKNGSAVSLNSIGLEQKGKSLRKSESIHYFYHHSNQEVCFTIMQSLNSLLDNDDILSTTTNNKLMRKSSQYFFAKIEKLEEISDSSSSSEEDKDLTEYTEDSTNVHEKEEMDDSKILKTINKYIKTLEDKGSKIFIYKKLHLYWSIYTTWEQIGECILDSAHIINDNFLLSREENQQLQQQLLKEETERNNGEEKEQNKMNSYSYIFCSRAGSCTSDTLCEYLKAFKDLYVMIRAQFKLENIKQLLTIMTGLVLYNSLPEHPNSPTPHYVGDKENVSNLQANILNIIKTIFLESWRKNNRKLSKRATGKDDMNDEDGPIDLTSETILKKQNLINKEDESIILEVLNILTVFSQLCFTHHLSLPNLDHQESMSYIKRMLIETKSNKLNEKSKTPNILIKNVLNKQYPLPPQFSMIAFSYQSLLLLSNAFRVVYYYPGIYSKNVYLNIFKVCYD